ncbi:MAG TPA: outer membrane protein assembly factor BamA [Bryobacteraceae bacterium]|nr:outer membrane protein assembly factor BamA [Bryobacteraceae bacterium]
MRFNRPRRLWLLLVCAFALSAQAPQSAPPQNPPQEKKPANPFETVPEAAEPAKPETAPQQPGQPFEQPKTAPEAPKPPEGSPSDLVEAIEFRGARRMPADTLRAMIFTKKGDRFDPETLRRDFMQLWNTGRFDDITLEAEPGRNGLIIRFVLVERQVVRSIKYDGVKSATVSEILDRFKEKRVGLSVESQYDPNRVQRASVVLKELLAERGRQYADVTPELKHFPPASLEVTFKVNEGPKVKVGEIDIQGNTVFSDRAVRRAMKGLRPIGIPHSLLFENLFAKSYDLSKLEMDKEMIRNYYQERGYWMARPLDHTVTMRKVGGGKFRFPLFYMNKPGVRADVTIPVEEGRKYKIRNWNYVGVKLFKVPEALTPQLFGMKPGDVFESAKFRKGIDQLRDLYGRFGYIDFVPDPQIEPVPGSDQLDLTFNVDEGKQFFVRRIDFQGNTTTRDKVIRRELMIDEGDLFNSKMWELSVLRLNQLGYFEALKKEDAAQITRNPQESTVDITLKVKERGKNSIGLTGGMSGIAGSFVGFNYSTNNFLGLGETLSIESQLGDRMRNVTFGFTEPYFLDRPIQLGFTVFTQQFNYDQGREVSLFSGRNYMPYYEALGTDNLLNYTSNSRGFTVFTSYPLRRSFARVSMSYGYSSSKYQTRSTAADNYFKYYNFMELSGPNQLTGIRTSMVTPSYSYNSVDHPMTPTRGRELTVSMGVAGSVLGGNVNMFAPSVQFRMFHASPLKKNHVMGYRLLGSFVSGYGGKSAPPFNRFYMGGEQDVRGFESWSITPMAFIPSQATVPVLNADGSTRLQKVIVNGVEQWAAVSQTIPIYQMTMLGGDTQAVGNFEYRVPIVGPVTMAAFFDAGLNKISRADQLELNPSRLKELNSMFPSAGFGAKLRIAPDTQQIRMSTGLELQVLLPVVNAPFRVYWAYNPSIVQKFIQPPIVADRSYFPNEATFVNAITNPSYGGQAIPWFFEKRSTFRFTIGRTF